MKPNLIEAGDIELAGETAERCLVIQFPDEESIRAAMDAGAVEFTKFEHYRDQP